MEKMHGQWYYCWRAIFEKETYTWLKNRRYSLYKEGDVEIIDAFEDVFALAEKSKGCRRNKARHLRTVASHGVI